MGVKSDLAPVPARPNKDFLEPADPASPKTELATQTERLRLLLDVSATLAAHRDLHKLLQEISTALQRLVKHDYASLSLYDREVRQLRLYALDFPRGSGLVREQVVFATEGRRTGRSCAPASPCW
jgi:transcriptional regulator with GAF, ATPase, and Fis domain